MFESAYEAREQTAVKHRILERYLSAFVPIVGDWALDIAYVDCLAGPWRSADPDLRDTSFARAIQVLRSTRTILAARGKSPTMRCLFIERDTGAFEQLQEYCKRITDIEVTAKNWDLTTHIPDVVAYARARSKSFPFIFLDPKGWEPLQINCIAPILGLDPGEVLITLMTSWITRFLPDESKGFERIFGEDLPRLMGLQGEELEEEAVKSYANAVRKAGRFRYVCTLPVMKPDQDAFHFYMIYCTRHIRGVEVFKETEKSIIPFMHETRARAQERRRFAQSGQYTFLDPKTRYRERKFTQFQLRNVEIAKLELRDTLESSGRIRYDDAWAMVMQHSTVVTSDLAEWLSEWKNAGLLQITNQQHEQRLPRKGQKQFLEWKGHRR
jgi:three-Cys-motif partner protein